MSHTQTCLSADSQPDPGWKLLPRAIVLILYAAILSRGISQPWIGLHDWNGAFYSQLARNLLRYPFDMHHGMPVIAVGPIQPAPGEWSFYATHPPGLVWCIAASFQLFGEHEWAARLVPIIASLATLALLCRAVASRCGETTACVTGVMYALLPMAAYFGRMPDQEAPCLFLMLAAVLAADHRLDPSARSLTRLRPGFVWSVCIAAAIWIDWVAIIPAALVVLRAILALARGKITPSACLRIAATPILAVILLILYMVYFGLGGHWADLVAVFSSRAGVHHLANDPAPPQMTAWTNVLENLTWPVLILMPAGIGCRLRAFARRPAPNVGEPRPGGLALLGITGVLWVAGFWRLFLIHQYWLFYLGPTIAILAAGGLLSIHRAIASRTAKSASWLVAPLGVLTLGFTTVGINGLFERPRLPLSEVQAWQAARRMIARDYGPDDSWKVAPPPVLFTRNPLKFELRGQYRLRSIMPPQFAYYFDYPFEVETDVAKAVQKLPERAGILIHGSEARHHAAELQPLQGLVEFHSFGNWQLLMPPHHPGQQP